MVDNKEEHLCIFEGYVIRFIDVIKIDVVNGKPKLLWALQNIQKFRGLEKLVEVIEKYKLQQFGITLQSPN